MNGDDGRVVLAAFVTSSVLAGGNAVAIRYSNRELDPLWGAALMLVGSALAGETRQLPRDGETWAALAYLVVVGSVVVFVLYLLVLERWSASRTSYQFLLIPVVTVALSAWLDDEAVDLGLVFGGLLVLAGVYVGVVRPMRE